MDTVKSSSGDLRIEIFVCFGCFSLLFLNQLKALRFSTTGGATLSGLPNSFDFDIIASSSLRASIGDSLSSELAKAKAHIKATFN